ncbi:MAG: glycoside hydrolase family 2 protein [Bacteroidetes bacterium]|nr:glycoside hydrolase family 2 protein [Bacteroidota bacterium]
MKKQILFLLAVTVIFSCSVKKKDQNSELISIEINSNWKFKQADKYEWLPATIPGTVHTDLLNNGKIEDPYYRLNEKDQQWIDKADWEYQTTFNVTSGIMAKNNIWLEFMGLDTYADIYLNGQKILTADNMFREWRVDCKEFLRKGENVLRVYLASPIKIGLEKLEANGYGLPAVNDQSENGELGDKKVSVFTRKAGYHFGWDWGPRLVTSGIWRPVFLKAWNKTRIENLYIVRNEVSDMSAKMTAEFEISSDENQELRLAIAVEGKILVERIIEVTKGTSISKVDFKILNPKLWWSAGLGEQHLYNITGKVYDSENLLDESKTKIGIRTANLIQKPDTDGKGKSFYVELNGRPVFSKGANYIPNDVFLPRVAPDKYENIVKSAAEANMNMLRVWGGGIYENDIFYDLCDKYGIMIWQDFMFACSMYPGGEDFFENVKQEAIDNVKRLRNHPSIVLWCGNNEIETAWGEYKENAGWGWKQRYNMKQRKEIWTNYEKVFHKILPEVVEKYSYNTFYWHSSPSAGMGKLSHYMSTSGDIHYWGVWHGQHPFSEFQKYIGRFLSEYGFQSFPEFKSVKKYTIESDWDIESEVMASHQRSGIGNLRIRSYMEDDYIIPEDFEQFLYVGQILQAVAIQEAIEAHRRAMPYCMGTLYWQINDCWPVASWSSMDYYGRWKALQFFARNSNKNLIVSSTTKGEKVTISVVSDESENIDGELRLKLIDFAGNELWSESLEIEVKQNTSDIYFEKEITGLIVENDASGIVLVSEFIVYDKSLDTDLHYFVKPKDLKLTDPGLNIELKEETDKHVIEVSSQSLVKNLFLTIDEGNERFSDNYFDVLPGETKTVYYPKTENIPDFASKIRSIHLQKTVK